MPTLLSKDHAIVKSYKPYLEESVSADSTESLMEVEGSNFMVKFTAKAYWESDEEMYVGVGGHDCFRTEYTPCAEVDIDSISVSLANGNLIELDLTKLPEGMFEAIMYELADQIAIDFRATENAKNDI